MGFIYSNKIGGSILIQDLSTNQQNQNVNQVQRGFSSREQVELSRGLSGSGNFKVNVKTDPNIKLRTQGEVSDLKDPKKTVRKEKFKYDKNGNLKRHVIKYADGTKVVERYKYNSDGRVKKHVVKDANGNKIKEKYKYYSDGTVKKYKIKNCTTGEKEKYKYNSDGTLRKHKYIDSDGNKVKEKFRYNDNGTVRKYKLTNRDELDLNNIYLAGPHRPKFGSLSVKAA